MAKKQGYTSSEGNSTPTDKGQSNLNNYNLALFGAEAPKKTEAPKKFVIKDALSAIREKIIDKFNELKDDKFFDGVSLKVFMTEILQSANRNADRMKTQKQFDSRIMFLVGDVMMRHKKIGGNDLDKLDAMRMRRYYGEDYQQRIK